ncbi:Alpha/beta hydrolase family protein [Pirellulimonas nuda]|uniref:Alpha/beta hydrolase family protein n=1 Tax=Pirellulimonas nuda TaxID=2528009 RepID=A0A518D6Z3_9BACT|nr:alpha/beta hydrolase [Pirellulimonas nuda]QDU87254.1 Alpha/beta hydrolase family protein [Pirellulimonas nuda]
MQAIHAVTIGVCASLVGCVSLSPPGVRSIDDAIVYQPAKHYAEAIHPADFVPEDAFFEADDGVALHGWYCPVASPESIILFAHGNAGNVADRWMVARQLNQHCNASVLLFDYRGYGRSEGTPSEPGLLRDARAARAWLSQRAGVPASDIVLYGQSLGGGVMVDLAANDGARALVLESTFTSLPDVAHDALPLLPTRLLMRNRFDSLKKIQRFHGPTWIAHGDADRVIDIEHGRKLYAAANEPKQFVAVPGQGHNWVPNGMHLAQLRRFLESAGKAAGDPLGEIDASAATSKSGWSPHPPSPST